MLVIDVENDNTNNDNDETSDVFSVNSQKLHSDNWNVLLESNSSDINYKIDTGAQVNVLPKNDFVKLLRRPKLKPTKIKLTTYNGQESQLKANAFFRSLTKSTKPFPFFLLLWTLKVLQFWV